MRSTRCRPWPAALLALLALATLPVPALGQACGGRKPQAHYSSKTAYEFVHNNEADEAMDQPHGTCSESVTRYAWLRVARGVTTRSKALYCL